MHKLSALLWFTPGKLASIASASCPLSGAGSSTTNVGQLPCAQRPVRTQDGKGPSQQRGVARPAGKCKLGTSQEGLVGGLSAPVCLFNIYCTAVRVGAASRQVGSMNEI